MGITRSFLEIMREVHLSRRAGLSAQLSLLATLGEDDTEWELLLKRLFDAARLEKAVRRMKPGSRK